MTPLRQRMLDALVLRGMAQRTQEAYTEAIARLARHYRRSPDTLSAQEVQAWLLHQLQDKHLSRSSVNQYASACRFLYGSVLGLDGKDFEIPLAPAPQRLPEILSRHELARLFAVARHVKSRTFLMTAYGTGLRLSELCHLRKRLAIPSLLMGSCYPAPKLDSSSRPVAVCHSPNAFSSQGCCPSPDLVNRRCRTSADHDQDVLVIRQGRMIFIGHRQACATSGFYQKPVIVQEAFACGHSAFVRHQNALHRMGS